MATYRAARFHECLSALHGLSSVAATSIRARALLRLGRPQEAFATLSGDAYSARDRAELAMLRGVAAKRIGNETAAVDNLRDALVHAISSADLTVELEVDYYRALHALSDDGVAESMEICSKALEHAESPSLVYHSPRAEGIVPRAHVVARLQELRVIVASIQGKSADMVTWARTTLATIRAFDVPDVYLEANALRNMVTLARDYDLRVDLPALDAHVDTLGWTREIANLQFTAREELGWISALHGDRYNALRRFREAENVAPTVAEHVLIGINRATLAKGAGYTDAALEELDVALAKAATFRWEDALGDSRVILLLLAQAATSIRPERARDPLARYTKIQTAIDPRYAARLDPRYRAEEAYTNGVVLRTEGRLAAATERLTTAFEIWNSLGHEWRAARAALELAELDAGTVFRLAVARELAARPESFFANRARRVAA